MNPSDKSLAPPAVGYTHPRYAESLAEFGTLRHLPGCNGWLLEREIPGSDLRDAVGCYPMFSCEDWSKLPEDIAALDSDLIALSMVPEVFGAFDLTLLNRCFDKVVPFKEHFVSDLRKPIGEIVSKHHRRYTRKAFKKIVCERHPAPIEFLDEWLELHATLVKKHGITGLRAYSRDAFALQLQTPGMVVLRAMHGETTVGAQLWFMHEDVAYGHVLAFSALGYELGAAYALYWYALEYFADKVRYCDYCGVSGVNDDTNGLSWFKSGWSTEMRTAYFCSRILQPQKYDELVEASGMSKNPFFPAYRTGI